MDYFITGFAVCAVIGLVYWFTRRTINIGDKMLFTPNEEMVLIPSDMHRLSGQINNIKIQNPNIIEKLDQLENILNYIDRDKVIKALAQLDGVTDEQFEYLESVKYRLEYIDIELDKYSN